MMAGHHQLPRVACRASQEFEFQQSRWEEEVRACHEEVAHLQQQLQQGHQVSA